MMKTQNASLVILALLALAGCATTAPPQVVDPIPPKNDETLQALNQLVQLKEEMKLLRNRLEENQFNNENIIRQQTAQIDDLEQRLSSLESGQVQGVNTTVNSAVTIPSIANAPANNDAGTSTVTVVETPTASVINTTEPPAVVQQTSPTPNVSIPSEEQTVSLSEQEAYDEAFDLLKRSRYEDAILAFQTLANTWPEGGLADDAYYWISEAHYVNREFEEALTGFRTVVNRYPDSQRVPEAMLKVGYIQYDIGNYGEAAETFRNILTQFPGHQVAVSAQTRLQRIEQTIQ